MIAKVCTYKNSLPTGASTSPILSNIVLKNLDSQLSQIAQNFEYQYSRYSDDFVFSSQIHFKENQRKQIIKTIKNYGFPINYRKTKIIHQSKKQVVTGIIVNKKTNLDRKKLKEIRAILHNWKTKGYKKAQQDFQQKYTTTLSLKEYLRGYISYIMQVRQKDEVAQKMKLQLDILIRNNIPSLSDFLSTNSLDTLQENEFVKVDYFQGSKTTVFYLKSKNKQSSLHKVKITTSYGNSGSTYEIITRKGELANGVFETSNNNLNPQIKYDKFEDFVNDFEGYDIQPDIIKAEQENQKEISKTIRAAFAADRNKHLAEQGRVTLFGSGQTYSELSPMISDEAAANSAKKVAVFKNLYNLLKEKGIGDKPIDLTNLASLTAGVKGVLEMKDFNYELEVRGNNEYRLLAYSGTGDSRVLMGNFNPKKPLDTEKLKGTKAAAFYNGLKAEYDNLTQEQKVTKANHRIDIEGKNWIPRYFSFNRETDKVTTMGEFPLHPLYQDTQKYGTHGGSKTTHRGFHIFPRVAEGDNQNMSAAEYKSLQDNWKVIKERTSVSLADEIQLGLKNSKGEDLKFPAFDSTNTNDIARLAALNAWVKTPKAIPMQIWKDRVTKMGYGVSEVYVSTLKTRSRFANAFGTGGSRGNAMLFYSPFHSPQELTNMFSPKISAKPVKQLYSTSTGSDSSKKLEEKEKDLMYKGMDGSAAAPEGLGLQDILHFETAMTRDLARDFGISVIILDAKPVDSNFIEKLMSLFISDIDKTKTLANKNIMGDDIRPHLHTFNYKQSMYLHYKLADVLKQLVESSSSRFSLTDPKVIDLLNVLFDPTDKYFVNEIFQELEGSTNVDIRDGQTKFKTLVQRQEIVYKQIRLAWNKMGVFKETTGTKAKIKQLTAGQNISAGNPSSDLSQRELTKWVNQEKGGIKFENVNGKLKLVFHKGVHPALDFKIKKRQAEYDLQAEKKAQKRVVYDIWSQPTRLEFKEDSQEMIQDLLASGAIKFNYSADNKYINVYYSTEYIVDGKVKENKVHFGRDYTEDYKGYLAKAYNDYTTLKTGQEKLMASNEISIRLYDYDQFMTTETTGVVGEGNFLFKKDADKNIATNLRGMKDNLPEIDTNAGTSLEFGYIKVRRDNKMQMVAERKIDDVLLGRTREGGITSNGLLEFLKEASTNSQFKNAWDAGNVRREYAQEYSISAPQVSVTYNPVAEVVVRESLKDTSMRTRSLVQIKAGDENLSLDMFTVS